MKNLIIFDCFGVIIKNDPSNMWMSKHFSQEQIKDYRKNLFPKADIGELNMQDIFDLFSKETKLSSKQIEQEFYDLCVLDEKLVEYIKQLKKDNIVIMLSNCPFGFMPKVLKLNGIENLFDKIILSYDCKMIKPNADIFDYVKSMFWGQFDKTIFVDDNNENVIGAKKANIDYAILNKGFLTTKKALQDILK